MYSGQVSEWFKEPVLKTGDTATYRGFESHPVRQLYFLKPAFADLPKWWRGSPAKGVGLERGARVQISQSASNPENNAFSGFIVLSGIFICGGKFSKKSFYYSAYFSTVSQRFSSVQGVSETGTLFHTIRVIFPTRVCIAKKGEGSNADTVANAPHTPAIKQQTFGHVNNYELWIMNYKSPTRTFRTHAR